MWIANAIKYLIRDREQQGESVQRTMMEVDEVDSLPEQAPSNKDITPINSMYCWGQNHSGELGLGKFNHDDNNIIVTPVQLDFPVGSSVKQVACGRFHTLVTTESGQVYSCGNNEFGQLGHEHDSTSLNCVNGLSQYVITHVVTGQWHSLALNEWGETFTWGADSHGQLGLESLDKSPQRTPKRVKGLASLNVVQACAGYSHCLVLTNTGELFTWGNNEYGQLGLGVHSASVTKPTRIESLVSLPIAFIACGANHNFIISKSGAVYGWGKNDFGQLGLSDEVNRFAPTHLKSLRNVKVKHISCGENYSVFLTQDGGVFTCGDGSHGQLGHGNLNNELLPRKVMELMGSTVTQVSCGRRHTLTFIPSAGRLYAFGIGPAVQLENPKSLQNTPQLVQGPWQTTKSSTDLAKVNIVVKKIYSGGDHSIVTVTKSTDNIPPDDFRVFNEYCQILEISLNKLKDCKTQVEQLKPDETLSLELLQYLETVFVSPACLNGSFLKTKDNEHFCCSSRNHGVDIKLASDCFNCIARIERESVQSLISSSISQIIRTLWNIPPDHEALRMFLTLPLYHEFMNPRQYETLQIPFAGALLNLKKEATNILGQWYTMMSLDYYESLILIYKQLLVYLLKQPDTVNKATGDIAWNGKLTLSLQVLQKLNLLNNQNVATGNMRTSSQHGGLKVPYTAFYISELSECCDIRLDYLRWQSSRSQGSSSRDFLCNYPFIFDAQSKTTLLQVDQRIQMEQAMNQSNFLMFLQSFRPFVLNQFLEITVSRDNIVEDTMRELTMHSDQDLKKPLRVKFIGEEAEDAGGVRREFLLLLMKEVLDPKFGMFKEFEETRCLWFTEQYFEDSMMYYLIGMLCGLAIYNFTIINMPFPLALYKKILEEPIVLQDLKDLSPTQARSLQDILDYTEDDLEDVFGINFVISRELFGEIRVDPLKPNGENIPVSQSNKQEFVELYIDFIFNKSVRNQFALFSSAFLKVCGSTVMKLFHAQELMAVVIGNENYDWTELEHQAIYKNGYSASDPTIILFWSVFHELPLEEKKKFLLFLTGCDRVPIKGMSEIPISFQPVSDDRLLPVAHTCYYLLDLPRYKTRERLRYKLLQAIQQTQGFSIV